MIGRSLLSLLLLAPVAAAAAGNWADDKEAAADPAYAASRALCAASRAVDPPRLAPGAAAPRDCSSEKLYFGIGMPVDAPAARLCAIGERAVDPRNDQPFAGTAMLMTIYANGKGAPRDLDQALALACTLSGAPAEMDGRVTHLAALRKDGPGPVDFSFCDDVTSGLYQGACAGHDSALAAGIRDAAMARLAAGLSATDKTAFAAANRAAEVFAKARGDNEVDQTGSGRAAFQIEAEDAVRDDALELLQRLADANLPTETTAQAAAADKALNAAYQAVMTFDDRQWGTPTKDGIRSTQRAWLAYRDALAAYATARAGQPAATAAVTWLTRRRTNQLKGFLS